MDCKSTTLVSFATPSHYKLQEELLQYRSHFSNVILFRDTDIDGVLQDEFPELMKYKKYHGYFIWKPFIIYKALVKNYNTNIMYVDSNLRFTNIHKFIDMYHKWQGEVFIPKYNHYVNKDWTKRDTFVQMNADEERFWNANQIWSVLMSFKNTRQNISLIEEYLEYCAIPSIATEEPNTQGKDNLPGFVEHRWEQSIMSILVEKYSIQCPVYNDFLDCVTKLYPIEIVEKKKEWANPLEKE